MCGEPATTVGSCVVLCCITSDVAYNVSAHTHTGYRSPGLFHTAALAQLNPNTVYYYRFGDAEEGMAQACMLCSQCNHMSVSLCRPVERGIQLHLTACTRYVHTDCVTVVMLHSHCCTAQGNQSRCSLLVILDKHPLTTPLSRYDWHKHRFVLCLTVRLPEYRTSQPQHNISNVC